MTNEVQVTAAPSSKGEEDFLKEVKSSICRISNLCGWDRTERENLVTQIEGSSFVRSRWAVAQNMAQNEGNLPIWEWNRCVREATDFLVESFYRKG